MIYLKIQNNFPEAYGNFESLKQITQSDEYDLEITEQEWEKAGYAAHIENGKIVLGIVPEFDGIDMSVIDSLEVSYEHNLISINEKPIHINLPQSTDNNVDNITWSGGYGRKTYKNTGDIIKIERIGIEMVIPFIKAYASEQIKLWNVEYQKYEDALTQYNSRESRIGRFEDVQEKLLQKYDFIITQLLREQRLADTAQIRESVTKEIKVWDLYAQSLMKMSSMDGFPWDGGGSKTPFPDIPQGARGLKFKKESRAIQADDVFLLPKKPQFMGVPLDADSKRLASEFPIYNQ